MVFWWMCEDDYNSTEGLNEKLVETGIQILFVGIGTSSANSVFLCCSFVEVVFYTELIEKKTSFPPAVLWILWCTPCRPPSLLHAQGKGLWH